MSAEIDKIFFLGAITKLKALKEAHLVMEFVEIIFIGTFSSFLLYPRFSLRILHYNLVLLSVHGNF